MFTVKPNKKTDGKRASQALLLCPSPGRLGWRLHKPWTLSLSLIAFLSFLPCEKGKILNSELLI